jgi:hypothetical protein
MAWVGTYVLDDDGNVRPAETLEWGAWMQTAGDKRRIGLTKVGDDRLVSTIFMGLDYSFDPDPMRDPLTYRPVLWETMALSEDPETGETKPVAQFRYASLQEAIHGHEEVVNQLIVNWTEAHQSYPKVEEIVYAGSATTSSATEPRPGA